MPQEPKKKHSKARKRTRRAALILDSLQLVKCSNCGKEIPSHRVCAFCGHYDKKLVSKKHFVKVTKA